MKRYLALLLSLAMLVGLCATAQAEEPFHITLLVRSFADDQTAADVEAAINDAALRDLNMTVDVVFVSFGNAMNQIQLMLSGNEDLDVTYVPGGNVMGYVNAGYLVDISQYDISPIENALGADVVAACRFADGGLYNVATFKEHVGQGAVVLRKDLCDELGIDPTGVASLQDLDEIFAKVKQVYPTMNMIGNDMTGFFNSMCDSLGGDYLGVLTNPADDMTVVNYYESDTFKTLTSLMYQWNEKGYVRADLSTSTESKEAVFAAGNTFCYFDAYKPDGAAEKKNQTGYDVYLVPIGNAIMTSYNTTVTGYAVAQNSKDPAKAVQFLNWMYTSSDFNNLINWGIEGKDYQVIDVENGIVDYPEGKDKASVQYHQGLGWNYPNQSIAYLWKGTEPGVWAQYTEWENNAVHSAALGCTFNLEEVVNEVATCNAVVAKYKVALLCGEVNPDEYLPAMNDELYAAGLQNIIDLKQNILNTWKSAQ